MKLIPGGERRIVRTVRESWQGRRKTRWSITVMQPGREPKPGVVTEVLSDVFIK